MTLPRPCEYSWTLMRDGTGELCIYLAGDTTDEPSLRVVGSRTPLQAIKRLRGLIEHTLQERATPQERAAT